MGDGRSSFTDSTSAKIETLQAQNDSVIARINALVAEQDAASDRYFNEKSKVIEDKVKGGYEKALLSSEEKIRKMGEAFDEKVNQFRNQVSTTVENYNRQFQATNLEISKNRVEATKQIQALTDRISNIQDISNNETVRELRGLVNGATSKVTELETSITREFTAVKKKNEDSLSAVKAEFTKGVDGLTSKVSLLEEYKNQDGSRTEILKQWVQRDTASQLSRERTEINKIIDNKGFVKNTEFSNKFNESARGITNQLSALETYKNQDGARVANMQIWVQNNTANQLTAARRSIESWVNEKGYATTSVVENKVRETANSFSREISNVRNSIPTSVGGRNYIPNSNFAKDFKNWEDKLTNSGLQYDKGHALKHFGRGLHIWGTPNAEYKGFSSVPFYLTAEQGKKLTLSLDLGKEYLNNYSILDVALHYIDGDTIIGQEWQKIDLATQGFTAKKYKRISKVFTVPSNITKCRVMIYAVNGQLANFYIDNIKLEKGDISTDWTPAPEDVEQNVNELNTWKQTATETLNTVSSGLNDTVKHSQLRIGANGINFGSNQVFDGRNLSSMLSVSPESIKAITDKLVITPDNENLAKIEYRNEVTFNQRDLYLNKISDSNKAGDEYYFSVEARQVSGSNGYKDLNAMVHVKYKDGTDDWLSTVLYPASGYGVRNCTATIKILDRNKEIEFIEPMLQQNTWSNYTTYSVNKLTVVKKKSAELIVDGSIEGRHIKTNTLETGHHKAGSITSDIIASNAVKAKHILIDDGLINNLVTHNAFISKLWAQDAFIKNLGAVKIKSTQLDTDWLSAYTGEIGGFRIGANPNDGGGFWLTGANNFECGINPGLNAGTRGAQIWAAWGNNWLNAGDNAWWVNAQGVMTCKNTAYLNKGAHIDSGNLTYKYGTYTYSTNIKEITYYSGSTKWVTFGVGQQGKSGNVHQGYWVGVTPTASDRRYKSNIKPTEINGLEIINNLKCYDYDIKLPQEESKHINCGIMAQDVEIHMKDAHLVNPDDIQSYQPFEMLPYLIKAIQELSEQNKELKNKLEEIING